MKDEELPLVRGITVRVECFHCKGKGRVPGGQRQYGEVIDCPVCNGRGTTPDVITVDQLRSLLTPARTTPTSTGTEESAPPRSAPRDE